MKETVMEQQIHITLWFNLATGNFIYDNVSGDAIYYWPGVVVTNLVEADTDNSDPEYVSPYTDFHLQAGSPAIGAGINVYIDVDFDGVAVGDPPDIGAYEYVS